MESSREKLLVFKASFPWGLWFFSSLNLSRGWLTFIILFTGEFPLLWKRLLKVSWGFKEMIDFYYCLYSWWNWYHQHLLNQWSIGVLYQLSKWQTVHTHIHMEAPTHIHLLILIFLRHLMRANVTNVIWIRPLSWPRIALL